MLPSIATGKLEFDFITAPSPISPAQWFDRHFIPSHPFSLKGQKDNYPFIQSHICQMTSLCALVAKEYNSISASKPAIR